MFFVGMVLFVVVLIALQYRVYRRNAVRGAVSETSLVFLLAFGMMDWKNNKHFILAAALGLALMVVGVLS